MNSTVTAPIRVLVIEDNTDDIALLTRQLDKAGMSGQVKFISEGSKALEFLSCDNGCYALKLMVIFLDLRLPDLNGIDVLRCIKSLPYASEIPVVIMTSSNNPVDMQMCQDLGITHYVEKPVTFSSFSKSMADVFHLPKKRDTQILPEKMGVTIE
jgi:two-component system, response regulator